MHELIYTAQVYHVASGHVLLSIGVHFATFALVVNYLHPIS